jgi:hypothetical protein
MAEQILHQIEIFFDSLFEAIGNILLSLIRRLAPFSVPAAPAYFFGRAVYYAAGNSDSWAAAIGMIAALGLESAGILSAHYAVKFYAQNDNKWQIAAAATGIYLAIGIGTITLLESTTADGKAVGVAMFLIAGIVYLLLALGEVDKGREAAQERARQERAVTKIAQQQSEHDLKLARIQSRERIKIAQIGSPNMPEERRQDAGKLPRDWRQLSGKQKQEIALMSPQELAQATPYLSERTRRAWRARVNGGNNVR